MSKFKRTTQSCNVEVLTNSFITLTHLEDETKQVAASHRFFKLTICDDVSHFCTKLVEVKASREDADRSNALRPTAEAANLQMQLVGMYSDKLFKLKHAKERMRALLQEPRS